MTSHHGTPVDRSYRRTTFDAVADNYDRGRPGYPDQLFADIVDRAQLVEGSQVLEIGPGTGHASLPFAKRGMQLQAYELGENLANRWRENMKQFPNASISVGPFESAHLTPAHYDLAFAATAFHWIDPSVGYQMVHDALVPGGWMALWWNRYVAVPFNSRFAQVALPIYEHLVLI